MPRSRLHATACGARSAFDITGLATLDDGLFSRPAWERANPWQTIGQDWAQVMTTFYRGYACSRDILAAGNTIEELPAGCTGSAAPRKLPQRHITATHSTTRR